MKVVYGERSLLLMADAIGRTQEYLLAHYDASVFKADVLKYPHHGYVNMTYDFLDAVDPEVRGITNTSSATVRADDQLAFRHIPRYFTAMGNVCMQTDVHVWLAEQLP